MNCTSKAKIHEHLNIHRCHKSTGITNDNFTCVQWLHYLYSICGFFERGGGGGGGLVCILKSHHLVNLIMLLLFDDIMFVFPLDRCHDPRYRISHCLWLVLIFIQ